MQQGKTKILYIVLVIALVIGIWHFWNKYNSGSEGSSLVMDNLNPTVEGGDQIARFERLNSIKLDLSVLKDERFLTLQNNEVLLPNLSVGKSDPFSSVSSAAAPVRATTTSSAATPQSSERGR